DDDRTGVRQATFAELAAETSRFAQLLRDLGVGAGERVLIRLANCLEYPVVFLGAMKRGAIPVPTSILLTSEEVVYLAADSGARVLVTDVASWNAMRDAVERLDHLTHALLVGPGDAARPARVDVRARHRPHGPALPGPHGDRARGDGRRRALAAPHRRARCHHLHRRPDDLPPDRPEDAGEPQRRAVAPALHERGRASLRSGARGM